MRVIIIGLDAFDPTIFERLYEQGRLPNLGKYVEAGKYKRFSIANPAQSEVSWTSIATGLNPGEHGLFDFVHRSPHSYALNVSLLPTKQGFGGTRFIPPFTTQTIFDQAVSQGYPATSLWWPATFPARPQSPVKTIPGLGTPDILGRMGVGAYFSSNLELASEKGRKIPVYPLNPNGSNFYKGDLKGPIRKKRKRAELSNLPFSLELTGDQSARLKIGDQTLNLTVGQWSPIFQVSFKVGWFLSVKAITSVILTQIQPFLNLYILPLQIHPLHSLWPYATPPGFVKQVWKTTGAFFTLGWPQDTTSLEEGCISDDHFLSLCEAIIGGREKVLMHEIDNFKEGVLACVFDTLDRVQHMFLRDHSNVIDDWYIKLDGLIGRIENRMQSLGIKDNTRLVILSDHGFAGFDYKVHLNRWLVDNGYLESRNGKAGNLQQVDWSKSKAYGIGLNSIYLNLEGREGQGSVSLDEKEKVLDELCEKLQRWKGPDGCPVIQTAYKARDTFNGKFTEYSPDIVTGFSPGYRASQQTGLGGWEKESIVPNKDHWGADHCIDHAAVPGVIFASEGLSNFSHPSYRDIPPLTIDSMPDSDGSAPPPSSMSGEDEEVILERLKSLGYL